MKRFLLLALAAGILPTLSGCANLQSVWRAQPIERHALAEPTESERQLADTILKDEQLPQVLAKAKELLSGGFQAGGGYPSVWIRDVNTFIEMALTVNEPELVRERLIPFFGFQGEDGNIPDGYAPKEHSHGGGVIVSDLYPNLTAHKNTVETDQESSLVLAISKYVKKTGDRGILEQGIDGQTVLRRLERALAYVRDHRMTDEYGLVWGATTMDWGDVQPEDEWGVDITEDTHRAIDVYDNALYLVAIDAFLEMAPKDHPRQAQWQRLHDRIARRTMKYLWDDERKKFKPHVYLDGAPWPEWFDESRIYYSGGPMMAMRAGLLGEEQLRQVYRNMVNTKHYSGAASIGMVNFPPYPDGFFGNPVMKPYEYQNAGDWTWWGGRTVQELIRAGMVAEAYEEIKPMVNRVLKNDGFYEYYTVDNEPMGSDAYRGSAGVLGKAIVMLQDWAKQRRGEAEK